ncbi:ATP-binding protein [Lautropia mirabilis]
MNECLQGLIGLMQTLHAARGIDWQLDVPGRVFWRGESTDLEEMLGNLLDNAGKWARSRVVVRVRLLTQPTTEDDGMRSRTGLLVICIEDDGAGLDDDEIARAIRRGQRFDESTEGSGLGLVIANDIAETYEGRLELGRSPLGGLHVTLRLPR